MSKLAVADNPIRQSTVLNTRARQEQESTEVQTQVQKFKNRRESMRVHES